MICLALAGDRPKAADVSWTAGVPLWTSLSPTGKVIDAGPIANWASPPPAARLGTRPEPLAAGPGGPRELPETLFGTTPTHPPASAVAGQKRTIRPAGATSISHPAAARLAAPVR